MMMLETVQRYFLWLDLRQSTHWLGQWGDVLYARILENYWKILNTQLLDIKIITIYQFVGDGLILEWQEAQDCPQAVFIYQQFCKIAQEQAADFLPNNLSITMPQFRAVLGGGMVQKAQHAHFHLYYGQCLHQLARWLALQSKTPNSHLWTTAEVLPFLNNSRVHPLEGHSAIWEIE